MLTTRQPPLSYLLCIYLLTKEGEAIDLISDFACGNTIVEEALLDMHATIKPRTVAFQNC